MANPSEPPQIHFHRFAVPCALHGRHVYYLAGLDHGADDAALFLLRTLKRHKYDPEYDGSILDLETLKTRLFPGGSDDDGLPF